MPEALDRPSELTWPERLMEGESKVRVLSLHNCGERRSPTYELVERETGAFVASLSRRTIHIRHGSRARIKRRLGRLRLIGPDGDVLAKAVPRLGEVWSEAGERAELLLTDGRAGGSRNWRRAELRREATVVVAVEIEYTVERGVWEQLHQDRGTYVSRLSHLGRLTGSVVHHQDAPTTLVAVCVLLALGSAWTRRAPREGHWFEIRDDTPRNHIGGWYGGGDDG